MLNFILHGWWMCFIGLGILLFVSGFSIGLKGLPVNKPALLVALLLMVAGFCITMPSVLYVNYTPVENLQIPLPTPPPVPTPLPGEPPWTNSDWTDPIISPKNFLDMNNQLCIPLFKANWCAIIFFGVAYLILVALKNKRQ